MPDQLSAIRIRRDEGVIYLDTATYRLSAAAAVKALSQSGVPAVLPPWIESMHYGDASQELIISLGDHLESVSDDEIAAWLDETLDAATSN